MTFEKYLARPGQSLNTHLDGVVENAKTFVPPSTTTPADRSLRDLVTTVAHLHDIGKLTPSFQKYIRERPDRPPTERETHADVGALLTFHALATQGFSKRACAAGFYAVLKHHGVIPNITPAHTNWTTKETRYPLIGEKLEAIDETATADVTDRLSRASKGELAWDVVPFDFPRRYRSELDQVEFDTMFYPLLLRVWSTLTCADKFDAAGVPVDESTERPDPDRISFTASASGVRKQLNDLRTRARTDAVARLTDQSSEPSIYTLTLPTGFGKTYAGLEAALQTAEDRDGRVVYALPYTTILDQVHSSILDQFDVSPQGKKYTLHHHLAETKTRLDDADEQVTDRTEALYGESWRAGLVLTTFVQLFESLAGPGNTQSMKLPALQDAVVVVDEPQVLQPDWWQLVARLSTVLTQDYDATVILMTATQPRFISTSDFEVEPVELIPETQTYFTFLEEHERVQFHLDSSLPVGDDDGSPRTIREGSRQLIGRTLSEGGTTLAINNTVQAASRFGSAVKDSLRNESEAILDLGAQLDKYTREHDTSILQTALDEQTMQTVVEEFLQQLREVILSNTTPTITATLTAALRPCDRGVLLATLRKLLAEADTDLGRLPVIVSSTQLIEAGVDISVDRVYRDYAPLPSVVQAAGRCNRSFDGDTGRVVLWQLLNEAEDRLPGRIVYGREPDRLQPTITALRETAGDGERTLPEAEMVTTAVEKYYDALHGANHRASRSDQFVRAYDQARGDDLRTASMIEDPTEDILVLRTTDETEVLRRYLAARERGAYDEAQATLQTLKHLLTSASPSRVDDLDTTGQLLSELGVGDVKIEEFRILDDRDHQYYDLTSGTGVRSFTD